MVVFFFIYSTCYICKCQLAFCACIYCRDDFDIVPNGLQLPSVATATKAANSATDEARKHQRTHRKDQYDYKLDILENFSACFQPVKVIIT